MLILRKLYTDWEKLPVTLKSNFFPSPKKNTSQCSMGISMDVSKKAEQTLKEKYVKSQCYLKAHKLSSLLRNYFLTSFRPSSSQPMHWYSIIYLHFRFFWLHFVWSARFTCWSDKEKSHLVFQPCSCFSLPDEQTKFAISIAREAFEGANKQTKECKLQKLSIEIVSVFLLANLRTEIWKFWHFLNCLNYVLSRSREERREWEEYFTFV